MTDIPKLNHPWLVAVWPGMGNVALSAGYYMMAKLEMNLLAEYEAMDLFDIDHVDVKEGILTTGNRPRNRFFAWKDPAGKRDIIVFIGEAQPPLGKYNLCRKLLDYANMFGVERVFTFAAMATQMHPKDRARVFGAATDQESLEELKRLELEILRDGHIGGLNGVLLGVAAEYKLPGACLLGEMPHIFAQLPFPRASLSILEVFTTMSGLKLDLGELAENARHMDEQLSELFKRVEKSYGQQLEHEEEGYRAETAEEEPARAEEQKRIENLFQEAARDRSKAFELKQELDRLGVFKQYEDRFLDLFKKLGESS
jgi:proteasome assembly chaperone (PAC2) family protein